MPTERGSIRLFRIFAIDVYVHWSWLVVAYFQVEYRRDISGYSSVSWIMLEYVALFGIVTLHEFGHALACKSVGGVAQTIVLWPLGGVAYVSPPPRPGPVLWSIAAGPLVNVLLVPVTLGLFALSFYWGYDTANPDLHRFLSAMLAINLVLLIFNMLPVYPLDGGQILQAILWFVIGRARSLLVASAIGIAVGIAAATFALIYHQTLLAIIAAFVVWRSWSGYQQGRVLHQLLKRPRHQHLACPACGNPPIKGLLWTCLNCGTKFDTFEQNATCPGCSATFPDTGCIDCGRTHSINLWRPFGPI